ncbi:MAG: hypothetical protein CR963_00185 [Gammaproteobacteria bacterium]|nr:MAG: hypothetical protein CR963_00185 [Gammaproteobacteria bacterium]
MRQQQSQDGFTALGIAGNHVVLLGWDISAKRIYELNILGFAIQRTRCSDGEVIWLSGMKTFKSVKPHPEPGVLVSTFSHPLQTFQWADYSVAPGQRYIYRIVAMCAPATQLVPGPELQLILETEPVDRGLHAVFFNRGAIASQEYARRFQNRPPSEVGQAAFDWLSRGLLEGLEAFIAKAGNGDELHGAFFEFKNKRVYSALRQAKARGAKITILYDADSQRERNEEMIEHSRIKMLTKARTRSGRFAHNKFLIWRQNGVSKAVWTGSTNLSENGLFGHSNNAHIVRDIDIAEQYEQYWQILNHDTTRKPTATGVENLGLKPPDPWKQKITTVFSPRLKLDVLDWYASLARHAQRGLFATFAFGMNDRFVKAYDIKDNVLRFALMEKKGSGRNYHKQAAEIDRIRRLNNVTIAVGNRIELNAFDRWLKETNKAVNHAHVLYVHTKYMLIDPLGDDPVIIVGSANFSKSSTDTNDENMLVIRGDKAVADIYLGEYMRLFTHYAFRESLSFTKAYNSTNAQAWKYLIEDHNWIKGAFGKSSDYFMPGSNRSLRRRYFSGQ